MSYIESANADTIFDVLSDIQRRQLLFSLLEHNPQVVSSQSSNTEERHRILQQHVHLPKLADAGFIAFESDEKIEKGPRFDEILPVLELLDDHNDELPGDLV
ncbi:DUF7344 domain-containing protein [Haladaptatus sp. DFWS20]|uniref:DUF7344 domain-containing protein n=1 Tax=Haladaptatus sp. DFWS20 TaxID=3403467 RepID=UPI003EBFAF44